MTMPTADVDRLAGVMADQAAVADDPQNYLRGLLRRADLPREWRNEKLGMREADLGLAARQLVWWADSKQGNFHGTEAHVVTLVGTWIDGGRSLPRVARSWCPVC